MNLLFKTEISVQVNHLNYGNHLGHDSVLTICQEARMRWLAEHQMTELSLLEQTGFMIVKAELQYKSEAFHGDLLQIEISAAELSKKTFDLQYKITNLQSSRVVALVTTKQIFYDFEKKQVASAPESFRALFQPS